MSILRIIRMNSTFQVFKCILAKLRLSAINRGKLDYGV